MYSPPPTRTRPAAARLMARPIGGTATWEASWVKAWETEPTACRAQEGREGTGVSRGGMAVAGGAWQ